MPADLHIHSVYSDGSFTAQTILKHAKESGISCISITDHDSIDFYLKEPVETLKKQFEIELISGVEMSASFAGTDIHILGYGIDITNAGFVKLMEDNKNHRYMRLMRIAEKLAAQGIRVDTEELASFFSAGTVSRLHLARYLQAKNKVTSIKEAFDKYLGKKAPAYIPSHKDDILTVITMIKEARGLVFLAHPLLYSFQEKQICELRDMGIDGIEVLYPTWSVAISHQYQVLADKYRLLKCGGSDCHGLHKDYVGIGTIKMPDSWIQEMKTRLAGRSIDPLT